MTNPTAAAKSQTERREGRVTRLSSRRSPTIVRTRKAVHQGAALGIGSPPSHRILPISRVSAPSASVAVNNAKWRRIIAALISTNPTLLRVSSSGPTGSGKPRMSANAPKAPSRGAKKAGRAFKATARSRAINVPRKPLIIKAPWLPTQPARGEGQAQPKRTSPAHRATSRVRPITAASGSLRRRGGFMSTLSRRQVNRRVGRRSREHQQQHDDFRLGQNAMGQMRRHVGPGSRLGNETILAQRQFGFTIQEVQYRRPSRSMLAQFLARGEAKDDSPDLAILINRTANDGVF